MWGSAHTRCGAVDILPPCFDHGRCTAGLNGEKMQNGTIAFTAVYLKLANEYIGFIEELPGMNSRGRTIDEARAALQTLTAEVFAEERDRSAQAHPGHSVVREAFFLSA